jgi:hypothetical protein
MEMRLYWIAYDYGHGQLEMLDGPFGTRWEAQNERDSMLELFTKDDQLVVVWQTVKVEKISEII